MEDERRKELLNLIRKEFIGPDPIDWPGYKQSNGEEILVSDPPRTRYIAGILYPQDIQEEESSTISENEIEEEMTSQSDEPDKRPDPTFKTSNEYLEDAEELINRSNAYRQSAISLTVCIYEGDKINAAVSAGKYETVNSTDQKSGKVVSHYLRSQIDWKNEAPEIKLPKEGEGIKKIRIGETYLYFDITYRYRKGNCLIYTFTLENSKVRPVSFKDDDCYFQVEFSIISEKGFCPLPDTQKININDEDYLSNQLLYRDVRNYAIGHGCAADWSTTNDVVYKISSSIFPMYEVKPIVPASLDGVNLEMLNYGPGQDFEKNIQELYRMCDMYEKWIGLREEESKKLYDQYLRTDYKITADRHISNCKKCLSRMLDGIELLKSNNQVRIAFQYMNLAMIMQQLHYNLPLQKWISDDDDNLFLENEISNLPDPYNSDTWYGNKERYGKWRPFQLAFVLMNLRSMADKNASERNIVDLIWFPTGGGKTEAYLGLSAYTIFIRRLKNRDDSGTAILMRYTLRLLTAQQYERASAMVCACDVIRKRHEDLFGTSRISIGLWVGSATTPNKMTDAVAKYDELYNGKSDENPFVILKCPWCGAQMGVIQKNNGLREIKGYWKRPEARKKKSIIFKCSNDKCTFSDRENPLPLYVVDEAIYESTPTLLLGTVDKFAMLPFRPQAQRIFGYYNGVKLTSPDLIIQDELHLISGPLGSMVGHYETMIDELCSMELNGVKIKPKIVASTATISRAKEQCHALYGCSKDEVFQFPPSGLNAGDSFFAVEDSTKNGRQYVGILASGSSSDATTSIRLFASLLYAAKELNTEEEKQRDPYWTNVGYFNSIRELGQARTWIRADIDQYLDTIYKRRHADKAYGDEYSKRRRYIWRDEELTSRIPGDKVTASLANLNIPYTGKDYHELHSDEYPIDICLATNMISVGLDVPRLGLMTVAGQPKTTSEYIQATSRVGRNAGDAPGIVFVLYRPGRPRDKSHYEHFKEYHSKLYCNVEPTSVTPFSAPVRERALHAIMIGMMRLESDDAYNSGSPNIPNETTLKHVEEIIRERLEDIDPEELEDTMSLYEEILSNWKAWHPSLWDPKRNRDWSFADDVPLMYGAGEHPNEAWLKHGFETPTSMRSVDASCEADLMLREYKAKED
ncbi:MAG: helicase-related protein [Erysipelotrichaceae bacterium]|nr:helicase-related protein [Erysipelotrichaceae bacterium]